MTKITSCLFGLLGGAVASIPAFAEGNLAKVAGNMVFFTVIAYGAWRFRKENRSH